MKILQRYTLCLKVKCLKLYCLGLWPCERILVIVEEIMSFDRQKLHGLGFTFTYQLLLFSSLKQIKIIARLLHPKEEEILFKAQLLEAVYFVKQLSAWRGCIFELHSSCIALSLSVSKIVIQIDVRTFLAYPNQCLFNYSQLTVCSQFFMCYIF